MEKVVMPEAVKVEVGCKVSWFYYGSEAEARVAGEIFRQEAVVKAQQGYDFGYQVPGRVQKVEGQELWVVVAP